MAWLENHLNLINIYATALENLENYKGIHEILLSFKISNLSGAVPNFIFCGARMLFLLRR
jgi:hypothetical protein